MVIKLTNKTVKSKLYIYKIFPLSYQLNIFKNVIDYFYTKKIFCTQLYIKYFFISIYMFIFCYLLIILYKFLYNKNIAKLFKNLCFDKKKFYSYKNMIILFHTI